MSSLNEVNLIGNTGKDPEIRTTQDGREIASLTIATSEHWTDRNSGERRERTEWHKVVIFNPNLVKIIKQYVKKGTKLFVRGQLHTRKWQDQSGTDRYTTEIVVQGYSATIKMLSGKPGGGNNSAAADTSDDSGHEYAQQSAGSNPADLDDEIPF